jgi:hypothetical protein
MVAEYVPFQEFEPRRISPGVYERPPSDGIRTAYELLNVEGEVALDTPFIEYHLNGIGPHTCHRLWRTTDFVRMTCKFDQEGRKHLRSIIVEKCARRRWQYLCEHYNPDGDGPILENAWDDDARGAKHLIDWNEDWALKVGDLFPNVWLIANRQDKFSSVRPKTEFEGFFKHRNRKTGQLHVSIVEAKVSRLREHTTTMDSIIKKIRPIKELYTDRYGADTTVTLAHYSNNGIIKTPEQQLGPYAAQLRDGLAAIGVQALFFQLPEGREGFTEMVNHAQRYAHHGNAWEKAHLAFFNKKERAAWDESRRPQWHMRRAADGRWDDVPGNDDTILED